MSLTRFPNGVSSFGMPILGGGGFTAPLMSSAGTAFFVDPVNGSDGNRGTDFTRPLATVSKALSLTTDKAGDVIYLMNDGNTSGTSREDATLTWSNDNTHLIGLCAPAMISQRARISPTTTNTAIVTPQLLVSGNGCMFANVSLFEGTSEDSVASIGINVTGARNYFWNVAVMNLGDVTNGHSGDEAGSAHVQIAGGSENLFENCYIGLDTVPRSAANTSVRFSSAASRNIFRNSIFPMFADATTPYFIDAAASGSMDRFNLFEDCLFYNATRSTATPLNGSINCHASAGGMIILRRCTTIGGGEWAAATNANIYIDMSAATGVGGAGGGEGQSFST